MSIVSGANAFTAKVVTGAAQGAIGQLYVANGINNLIRKFNCQQHVNRGSAGMLTDDPTTNKLDVKYEQHDQLLKSKRFGVGFSTNVSEQGVGQPSKISIDLQNKRESVTQYGLKNLKNDQLKASTIVPSLHKPDTSADFDPLYELQREISNRNKSIRGEPQYPSSPVPVNSKHGILQSSPVEVVAKPIENVSAPTLLDDKFLDKPGFAYTQPHINKRALAGGVPWLFT